MSVGSWEPAAIAAELTATVVDRLCRAAQHPDAPGCGLDDAEVTALAPFARDGGAGSAVDWSARAVGLESEQLVALIRFLTLAEMTLPGWKGGDRSPVIALAAILKQRGDFPAGLTAWIRASSDNRFLPYGSLLKRL